MTARRELNRPNSDGRAIHTCPWAPRVTVGTTMKFSEPITLTPDYFVNGAIVVLRMGRGHFRRSRTIHTSPHFVQRSDTKCGVNAATAAAVAAHAGQGSFDWSVDDEEEGGESTGTERCHKLCRVCNIGMEGRR